MISADHALTGRLSATIPARRAAGSSVSAPAAPHTPLLQGVHRRADQLMTAMLWVLGLLSLIVGNHYGSTGLTLALSLPMALLGTLMAVTLPARLATRLAMAVLLMIFVALLIHQAHGQVEFHFLVFVSLSLLLAYRDFRVILLDGGGDRVASPELQLLPAVGLEHHLLHRPELQYGAVPRRLRHRADRRAVRDRVAAGARCPLHR